ncbi:MAG: hypothetical protein PHS79_03235 [Patescibacteria group bacterium]|nr:hypothetical protein [Patescibacteria group bacterium]
MFSLDKNVTAWYKVLFDASDCSVCVIASSETAHFVRSLVDEKPVLKKWFDGIADPPEFNNSQLGAWGFGTLCTCQEHEEGRMWRCRLPVIFPEDADGYALIKGSATGLATAATMCLLFKMLNMASKRGDLKNLQVAVLEMAIKTEPREFPIFLSLSPAASQWTHLSIQHTLHLEKVSAVMESAHGHMSRSRRIAGACSAELLGPENLHLSVPAIHDCSLSTCANSPRVSLELSPHNVDTALQQLTLLAGAAELCNLIGRELWPQA